ncbi:transcription elongation factor SPT6 homolog isoform X2 [Euphorbia lathyris]|uniref:transcription elongation factor SPT6 homolog isoform X2 n=1 Tax=Euphorbia lathyris TaxID=212925 RepID=UPI003314307E
MNRRKKKLYDEGVSGVKKNANAEDVDVDHGDEDEDDDDSLDEFESDGFIVSDNEEEEDQDGKNKWKRKKKYSNLFEDFVLDDDDLELLQENKNSGIGQSSNDGYAKFKRLKKTDTSSRSKANSDISDDDELLCDDGSKDGEVMSDAEEDEMADFIVYDEIGHEAEVQTRQLKQGSKRVTVASSSVPEEASNMFGNMAEILNSHVVKVVQSDDINGYELDKYATERNDRMNKSDVPERMQMSEEIAGPAPVDEKSREEESSWILNQLSSNTCLLSSIKDTDLVKRISKEDIMTFLKLRHVEKYDIPFIAMYRKERCRSLLEDQEDGLESENDNQGGVKLRLKWHKVLWAIDELDKKYLLIQKRKNALQIYYNRRYEDERCNVDDVAKLSSLEQQFDRMIKSLKSAETERDIDDVDAKFNMYFPPSAEGKIRKSKQSSRIFEYSNCSEAGLSKLAGKFGYSAEQFGSLLTLGKPGLDSWEAPTESPETIALNFLSPTFGTPEAALKGARLMAAIEISSEPCVRKHFSRIFMEKALVSTCPTPEGDRAIDSFHLFYGVKWLSDKPVDKFEEVQWLLIQKAEEEKLLQVTINIPEIALNKLITDSHEFLVPSSDGVSAQLWNEQRKLIMQDVFLNFLLPSFEKETRDLLAARAKNWLLEEYRKQLWKRASVAPYQQNENPSDQEKVAAPRIMACCWGPGKPPITFVMLGPSGQLVDVLETGSLGLRSQNVIDQQRKKYDQQRVLKFISNHKPSVIVLGALNISCTWLKDDMDELIRNINEDPGEVDKTIGNVSIVYGDLSLPEIYETSEVSSCQLPGQQGIVRRAVALGRYLQNPLAMIATLCSPQKEIVTWKLSSLDHFLTPDEKYGMIERVLLDITNQVGIDVDFAQSHDWLLAPLQFVSGLGPQKAAFIQRELLGGKTFNSRYDMASCGLMGKKIFYNAVGFLRVHSNYLLSASSELALFDDTRVHPESYVLAEKFVKAVVNDDSQEQPLLSVKDNPELLDNFNVDDYAEKYEIEHGESKRETLHAIKDELLHGFLDPRIPYENLTQDELFILISGKNEDAFAEGRIIQVTVRRVLSQRAFCGLDSGLTGVIAKEDYLDGGDDFSLPEKLHEGDLLTCKIKYLDKTKYQVFLTCKESELRGCRNQNPSELDQYYSESKKSLLVQQNEAQKDELAKKHFKQRNINHPHFKNITSGQAMEFLSDKDVGESIFHPSSRGPSYLTLTLKVYDGLFVHKDIIEGEKDCTTITSLLHIGKSLKIGDSIFNDLDEVLDRFVNPLVSHLKAMISFRKFKKGSKAEIDGLLKAEKAEYPMRIPYCFGLSYEHPGTFILSYIRTNLHHEYVGVYPEGFKYRKQIFAMVEQVVAYFQKHIDDPIPKRNLSSSSTEGSNDGGWQSQFGSGGGEGHPSGLPRPNGDRGRGRGRGRRGRGRRDDSDNNGNDYSQKDDFSGGWSGGGSGNSDDFSSGGRGRGNRGGRGGRRGRGRFNSDSDSGYNTSNWGSNDNDNDKGEDDNRMNTSSGGGNWGAGASGSWGGNNSNGNSSGGNAGGGWSSSFGSESKGILGSGPASPPGDSKKNWGSEDSGGGGSGWGGGGKKNKGSEDSDGGGSGWGGGDKKNWGNEDSGGGGGSGWGGGGKKNKGSEDSDGGGSGWGGGDKKNWGNEDSGGGGGSGWGGGGKKNLGSEDSGGGSGWGGGGKKNWGSEGTGGGGGESGWGGGGKKNWGSEDTGGGKKNWGSEDSGGGGSGWGGGGKKNWGSEGSGGGGWGGGDKNEDRSATAGEWGGRERGRGRDNQGGRNGRGRQGYGGRQGSEGTGGESGWGGGGKKNWGSEDTGGGGESTWGGGKKNWGSEDSGGGGSGWGGGGKKNWGSEDTGGGGESTWGGGKKNWGSEDSGGGKKNWGSEDSGGGESTWGGGKKNWGSEDSGGGKKNWGSEDSGGGGSGWSGGGKKNWGSEDSGGGGSGWGGGGKKNWGSEDSGGGGWGGGDKNEDRSNTAGEWSGRGRGRGRQGYGGRRGRGRGFNSGSDSGDNNSSWGGNNSGGNSWGGDASGGGGSNSSGKKGGWGSEDNGGQTGWGGGGSSNSGKKDWGSKDSGGQSGWGGGGNSNSEKKDGWGSGASGGGSTSEKKVGWGSEASGGGGQSGWGGGGNSNSEKKDGWGSGASGGGSTFEKKDGWGSGASGGGGDSNSGKKDGWGSGAGGGGGDSNSGKKDGWGSEGSGGGQSGWGGGGNSNSGKKDGW